MEPKADLHAGAGSFTQWLEQFHASLTGDHENTVACGDCIGCCTSSYFIHIAPQDAPALQDVPAELCFPAPGLPPGNLLMGYGPDGHCPMMTQGRCQVYASRPVTCRKYDCRIFAAAGILAGGPEKQAINEQVRKWTFRYDSPEARGQHEAVRKTAAFLTEHRDAFPGGRCPDNPSQIARIAIQAHPVFLRPDLASLSPQDIALQIIAHST